MKKIFSGVLQLLFLALITSPIATAKTAEAEQVKSINLLSWWGYLDYPEIINSAEKECGVKISFDEYFSNDEFLRRWESHRDYYDIIIFSDTIYNIIKNKLPQLKDSALWKQAKTYHPLIKEHYFKAKYPHNIVYFTHAMTGFLWNPNNINITPEDSMASIFKKAKQKYVVIIDDPIEAKMLLETSLNNKSGRSENFLSIPDFKNITQNAEVYITNNYSQIYLKPDFAFSFSWSGEAIVDLAESKKNYSFLIHPKLSYISSDLLMQASNKKEAFCVSQFLSSKKTSAILQNKDFYFSPYANYSEVNNPVFKTIYKKFIHLLPSLTWIDSTNENEFQELNKSWQLIKLSLNDRLGG